MKRQTENSSNSNVRMEELQNKDNESKRLRLENEGRGDDPDGQDEAQTNEATVSEEQSNDEAGTPTEPDSHMYNDLPPETSANQTIAVPDEEDRNAEREALKKAKLHVLPLEGHSDIVWSVDMDGDIVISASRDTTAKVWNAEDGTEMCSFRGHTDSVNAIILLTLEQSKSLAAKLKCSEVERMAISGSLDCSVRIWSLPEGKEVKSVYTFNGITGLGYVEEECHVLVGTDGGKLELWDVINGKTIHSIFAHEDAVSCLKVRAPYVYTASVDGSVKVWLLEENMLQLVYTRHQQKQGVGEPSESVPRKWKALAASDDILYLGDTSATLKLLKWKTGKLNTIWNQCDEVGITEALCITGDILLSSAYDINNDSGMINVWFLPHDYICSLTGGVRRILSVACTQANNNSLRLVTGGSELLVWNCDYSSTPPNDSSQSPYKIVLHKELEQISEDSNASVSNTPSPAHKKCSVQDKNRKKYWFGNWCTVI